MPSPYAKCAAISSNGSEIFWAAVKKHLDRISTLRSGPIFFQAIQRTGKRITIKMADTSGNSTSFANTGAPLLVQAILANDDTMFRGELKVATRQAASKGIPLDHIARQLSNGLTPVTGRSSLTVARELARQRPPVGTRVQPGDGSRPRDVVAARTLTGC